VVVANVPVPAPNDPRFGGNILGRASEAGSQGQGTFGVTRGSQHPETAMDFLLFMVSMRGQEIWTQTSGWLPSVVGVEPSEESKPFLPLMDGFPTGFELGNAGQADVARVMEKNFHKLVSPTGSVEAYLGSAKQDLPGAVLSDLRRSIASRLTNARRADTTVGVLFWEKLDANGAGTDAELDLILEGSNVSDRAYYRGLRGLTTLEPAQ
jgi:raffinose/stachyose/melibiose transport system substrate-binding protein